MHLISIETDNRQDNQNEWIVMHNYTRNKEKTNNGGKIEIKNKH